MPLITLPEDPIAKEIEFVNSISVAIGSSIRDYLLQIKHRVSPREFFADPRIGKNGGAILQKLAAHIQFLRDYHPEALSTELLRMGSDYTVSGDGSVIYTPAPKIQSGLNISRLTSEPFNYRIISSYDGEGSLSYSAEDLPGELSMDESGYISGAITQVGSYVITLRVNAPNSYTTATLKVAVIEPTEV